MTALERAARAAYESPHGPQRLWSDLSDDGKELARHQVRAVLMAVRGEVCNTVFVEAIDRILQDDGSEPSGQDSGKG